MNNKKATLQAIWIKTAKSGPMKAVSNAILIAGKGLKGNANIGGKRQVTIIEKEVWDRHNLRLGTNLPPCSRRANLMISGLPLMHSKGNYLKIGNCLIEVMGETKPCSKMDSIHPGLQEVMKADWGGGAYGRILNEGVIQEGDPVEWVEAPMLSF